MRFYCTLFLHAIALLFLTTIGFGEAINIAAEGTASQSSEWNGGLFPASYAIDGDINSFSHTDTDTEDNHWLLAFDTERPMQSIEVIARADCCSGRLTDTVLRILDDEGESVFVVTIDDPGLGQTATFKLPDGTFGKSLRIGFEEGQTNPQGNRVLHLGEVRVLSDASAAVTIESFTASSTSISSGESVTLAWVTSGATGVEIPGVGMFSPSGETAISPAQSVEFVLLAMAEDGGTVAAVVTVIVDDESLPITISEFMAAPASGDDWIEIHNPNPQAANLDGYRLTDIADHSVTWTFPIGTVIGANGYLLLSAIGDAEGAPLDVTFRLAREAGSYLALLPPKGETASAFVYPEQKEGISYGTDPLQAPGYFLQPTPGQVNGVSEVSGFVADTRFSHDRGFYSELFDLEITTETEGATILVTFDGTKPESENPAATTYSGPLRIEKTTVVRAAAHREGFLSTNTDTQTYLFIEDILAQPEEPEGFPLNWGNGPGVNGQLTDRSDFAMDPRIVGDAPFTDLSEEMFDWDQALKSIPSMSLVLPILDLLDPNDGIHARARSRGRAWEREASVEIIDPIEGTSAQANCGLRMHGGWNRFPEMLKKSMRLYFRGEYGDTKLRYPLFADSDVVEFDRLVLRSGNGKTWASPWRALSGGGNSLPRTTYLRDQFVRETQRDLGHPIAHGNFVHLYVNGLYWGLYNPAERIDEQYATAHFGGAEEDYEIVKWIRGLGGLQLVSGTTDGWVEMRRRARLPMSDPANYESVLEMLDPVNLIDYMITNMYAGNIDWQDNNGYAVRNSNLENGGDGKWRFFSWDGEETFLSTGQDSTQQNVSNTATEIYNRLQGSEEFRMLFADRLYRAFFNGGALSVESADARWMTLARWIDHAIVGESARWGDRNRSTNPYDRGDWEREVFNISENYIGVGNTRHRTETTLRQFTSRRLYPDIDPPLVLPVRDGSVSAGHLARLENPEGQESTIYYTVDGTDPRAPGGTVSATAHEFTGGSLRSEIIRANTESTPGSEWKFLDTGADVSMLEWNQPDFDDSNWGTGASELGYGDRNERTVVSFGGDAGNKFITTYFRHTFDLTATGTDSVSKVTRLDARVLFDDGVVVYLNGTEVARFFMPEGVINADTPALSGGDENEFVEIRSIDASLLRAGSNTLAIEVHQTSKTNSDISLDVELTADYVPDNVPEGIVISETTQLKARAFDGEDWSALEDVTLSVTPPAVEALAISEIYYAPGNGHPAGAEFIELVNRSDAPIDLTGITFTRGIRFTFKGKTLAPGERILIIRNRAAFTATFPNVPVILIAGEFTDGTALNNGGERVELSAADGSEIAAIDYASDFPWPEGAGAGIAGGGYSLTWISGTDPSQPENWRTSVNTGGSPGSDDTIPPPMPAQNLINYYLVEAPSLELQDDTVILSLTSFPGTDTVTLSVEESSDLINWSEIPNIERIASKRSAPNAVVTAYSLGNSDERRKFVRARVQLR
ncbi:MAG: hypothetical protein ACI9R3_001052 [Verrucomicrobiales bacterium]|jgi:hypothetical protein